MIISKNFYRIKVDSGVKTMKVSLILWILKVLLIGLIKTTMCISKVQRKILFFYIIVFRISY
jgi:hypothetical protein